MSCGRAQRDLALLGTGELEARHEAALWRHLDACEACRAFREEEGALDEVLSRWKASAPRRDIGPEVLAAAGEATRAAPRPGALRGRLGPLLAAAAILAALAFLPLVRRDSPVPERNELEISIARAEVEGVPIGTDLSGLALPARNPFRP